MIRKIKNLIKSIWLFFRCPDIPRRDRLLAFVFLLLIISPFDLIPEAIPGFGVIDDLLLLALLYDLIFLVLPFELVGKIYQGSEAGLKRWARWLAWLGWIRPASALRKIWRSHKLFSPPSTEKIDISK